MNPTKPAIVLTLALITAAALSPAHAELRFGPWVYWAPYYYPSPEKLQHIGFKPEDLAPRYQAPNPLPPKSEPACMPPPPPGPQKVADKSALARQLNGPVAEVPERSRPTTLRQPPPSDGPAPRQLIRVEPPSADGPRPVGSTPGSSRAFPNTVR